MTTDAEQLDEQLLRYGVVFYTPFHDVFFVLHEENQWMKVDVLPGGYIRIQSHGALAIKSPNGLQPYVLAPRQCRVFGDPLPYIMHTGFSINNTTAILSKNAAAHSVMMCRTPTTYIMETTSKLQFNLTNVSCPGKLFVTAHEDSSIVEIRSNEQLLLDDEQYSANFVTGVYQLGNVPPDYHSLFPLNDSATTLIVGDNTVHLNYEYLLRFICKKIGLSGFSFNDMSIWDFDACYNGGNFGDLTSQPGGFTIKFKENGGINIDGHASILSGQQFEGTFKELEAFCE